MKNKIKKLKLINLPLVPCTLDVDATGCEEEKRAFFETTFVFDDAIPFCENDEGKGRFTFLFLDFFDDCGSSPFSSSELAETGKKMRKIRTKFHLIK